MHNKIKHLTAALIFVLIFVSGCIDAYSAVIYVSPKGNDNNNGTKNSPFATLYAAKEYAGKLRKTDNLSKPVEIIILDGEYFLPEPVVFTAEDSGTELSPLIIKGTGNSVLNGGKALPEFEKISDNLWKTKVLPDEYGNSVQQVYINGSKAIRAREPNNGFFVTQKGVTEKKDDSNPAIAEQCIKLTPEQFGTLPKDNTERVIISINHAWDQTRKYIKKISPNESSIYIEGRPMQPWNTLDNSSQFILENHKDFLNSPGEYFIDNDGTLFYIPKPGETVKNTIAIVPVIDNLIIIKGTEDRKVENIRFENISFKHTRYVMPETGDDPRQAAAPTAAAIMADYAGNITFDKCEISFTGNNGVWLRTACTDCCITGSHLHNLGIGGIKIGSMNIPQSDVLLTKNITIDNNIIHSGGKEIPTGTGVLIFQASDNTVSHNDIADFRYTGVSVGWVWGYSHSPSKRNKIIYNHIHHIGWGELSDMGGIYTLGASEGTLLANNHIHDIYSFGYGGWGLYTDEGSTEIVLENNLVYKCKSSGFHQHYGKENIIRNNIFALNYKSQLEATRIEEHTSFFFTNNIIYFHSKNAFDSSGTAGYTNWEKVKTNEDYNCFWSTNTTDILFGDKNLAEWRSATGKDINSIIENPGFPDPENGDFTLKNKNIEKAISFKPFDYTKAGVYGNSKWKNRAILDKEIINAYNSQIQRLISEQIQ